MSLSRLMKISPNGCIQFRVNSFQPKRTLIQAYTTPSIKPIITFQCSANPLLSLFIFLMFFVEVSGLLVRVQP